MAYFLINGAPIIITNINATKNEISSVIYPASTKPGNISGMSSDHKYFVSTVATANVIIMKRINIINCISNLLQYNPLSNQSHTFYKVNLQFQK